MPPRKPVAPVGVLALLAGGGALPAALATSALAEGYAVHVLSFTGQPQPEKLPRVASHKKFPLGQIGAMLDHLRELGATHVALGGHLQKPALLDLKPDLRGIQAIARLLRGKDWHDDALLRAVATLVGEHGYTVLGVEDLLPGLLAPKVKKPTALGRLQPTDDDLVDLQLAVKVLAKLGELDIGQAVVVDRQTVLGVEAAEGTDGLLARCAPLRAAPRGGLLVKMAKPGQTRQADLPTIGPVTLANLRRHGYRGVMVQAGATVLLAEAELVATADRHGLLLMVAPAPWARN